MRNIVYGIQGMTCQGCVNSVKRALASLSGVIDVSVDLDTNRAYVTYDNDKIGPDALKRRIEDAGYEAEAVESK